ncbi:MAG: disulfide bond formation protein B [Betaproteobacteria bacterium]|nr:disulfide bond formation protein B [Betaproteobacteria bacterium]
MPLLDHLPPRRACYLLGFLLCSALLAYAFYLQFVEELEPCPLCYFQRLAMIGLGLVFLAAALHNPRPRGALVYALLQLLIGGTGAAIAARHVWIQHLPPEQVPSCGMGIFYMLDSLPVFEVINKTLAGSGECAKVDWTFLGLSIPGWNFLFFLGMVLAAFILVRARR